MDKPQIINLEKRDLLIRFSLANFRKTLESYIIGINYKELLLIIFITKALKLVILIQKRKNFKKMFLGLILI